MERIDQNFNARATIFLNDVKVHNDVEIITRTTEGDAQSSAPGPIMLQDHDHAVRFRNIWLTGL